MCAVCCCTGSSFEAKFSFGCQKSAVPLARDASAVRSYLSCLFAGDDNEVFPYGVDPAFLRSSDALYRPELQGREGWYYNTSDPMQVPPATKAPYGFFPRHLKVSFMLCASTVGSVAAALAPASPLCVAHSSSH
jgi:hypothetical protein